MRRKAIFNAAKRFLTAYLWIVRTHFRRSVPQVLLILGLSSASAFAQGSVIAFIAFVLHHLQDPKAIGIGWIDQLLANRITALLLLGGCLGVLAISAACANYLSALRSRALARKLHQRTGARILAITTRLHESPPSLQISDSGHIHQAVMRNATLVGRASETMLRMVEPAARAFVMLFIILNTDARFALVLLPYFLVLVPGLYRVGMRVTIDSRSLYEESVHHVGTRVSALARMTQYRGAGATHGSGDAIESYFNTNEHINRYFDQYDAMILAAQRMQFLGATVGSVFLGVALIVAGYLAASQHLSWSVAMALLLAIWQLQNSIRACMNMTATLNRFYPFVMQTRTLLEAEHALTDTGQPAGQTIHLAAPDGAAGVASTDALVLTPGHPAFLMTDQPVGRLRMVANLTPLARSSGVDLNWWLANTGFASHQYQHVGTSLGEALVGYPPDAAALTRLNTMLRTLQLRDAVDQLPDGLDTLITIDRWSDLPLTLRYAIAVLPLAFTDCRVLVCAADLLQTLGPAAIETLGRDRFLLIHADSADVDRTLADQFIVLQDGELLGFGDSAWFASIEDQWVSAKRRAESLELDQELLMMH